MTTYFRAVWHFIWIEVGMFHLRRDRENLVICFIQDAAAYMEPERFRAWFAAIPERRYFKHLEGDLMCHRLKHDPEGDLLTKLYMTKTMIEMYDGLYQIANLGLTITGNTDTDYRTFYFERVPQL